MKAPCKWTGGKSREATNIIRYFPSTMPTNYYEPFVGMGSLLLAYKPTNHIYLNDINSFVNLLWRCLRNKELLHIMLYELDCLFLLSNTEEEYYKQRDIFNKYGSLDNSLEENIFPKLAEQSARFIYLLNFGYNGLCRFNKQGKFNVPYGKQSPNIDPIVNNLVKIHNYLNSVDLVITNTSYSQVDTEFDLSSSFFYLDPPYDQTFNSYWNDSVFDQVQLFNWINHSLNKAKWLMTNSGTDLIRELYRDYEIIDLSSFRCVGATKESRVKVNDVIIRNYKD